LIPDTRPGWSDLYAATVEKFVWYIDMPGSQKFADAFAEAIYPRRTRNASVQKVDYAAVGERQ